MLASASRSSKWCLSFTFSTTVMYTFFTCPISTGCALFNFVVYIPCHSKLRIQSHDKPAQRVRITYLRSLSLVYIMRRQTPQRWGPVGNGGLPNVQNSIIICGLVRSVLHYFYWSSLGGRIEVLGRRGRRHKQLLDDINLLKSSGNFTYDQV
jgi:hypothetical protein